MTWNSSSIARLLSTYVRACVLAAVFLSVGGCSIFHRKPPPVIGPPDLTTTIMQFAGTPLTGPTSRTVAVNDVAGAAKVNVTWIAIDNVPATQLPPLDSLSRLTIAPLNSDTLLPAGMITRAARFGSDGAARQFFLNLAAGKLGKAKIVAAQTGLVVPGTTIVFDSVEPPRGEKAARRVAVSISRLLPATTQESEPRPDQAMFAVRLDDYVRASSEGSSADTDGRLVFGQETALLDDISLGDGSTFALLAPLQFEGTPWRALAAVIEIHAATEGDQPYLARLAENLKASSLSAQGAVTRPSGEWSALSSAIAGLRRSSGQRSSLLFLAGRTDASIAADFVLVADDASLAKLANEATGYAKAPQTDSSPRQLGWLLDRTSLHLMAQSAAKTDSSPEYASLLTLYGGEAGRHADSIEEILKTVSSRQDLDLRLTAENLIFLEDNSPSARVRAFDWLQSQGKAPKDFDPLGDAKSRRAAIDRALSPAGGNP